MPDDPGRATDRISAPGGHVLIADDSRVNRAMMSKLLRSLGHDVDEAPDGNAALARLRDASAPPIDLVLLDLVMPELDGFATLAEMKRDPALATIPVIVVSGLDDLDSIVRCVEMGAADYLPRPIRLALLRARVETSLAEKRLRDEVSSLLATVELQRSELARFLSPQVAALISSPDGEALLAGHRRPVTAVFCDLRGFTAFAETAEPEELLGVLRAYHAAMGRRIVEFEGTLEHFAGDGMHIFFNDPVPQSDHQLRAVTMALAMRDDFRRLATEWRRHGYELGFGVGLAIGHATAGRIGYEGRYDYAAIGNAVILAARLSGEAAPDQILATQRLYADVEDRVAAEPVEGLVLKGLSHPITAWSVVGLRSEAPVAAG
ncbi:MAG: adenylate/guanylate cyclase domain-containing protein [Chloroflexota bacterium]